MSKKKLIRYKMDPKSAAADRAAGLMGIGMFLRIVFFFALTRLEAAGAFMLIFGLILPLVAEVAFIVLLKVLRFNNPQMYILIGALICGVLTVLSFQYAGVLRMILGILVYLGCCGGLMAMIMGFVPSNWVKWGFWAVAAGRFLFFNLIQNVFGLHPAALVFEAAAMLELLALSFFTDTLKSKK